MTTTLNFEVIPSLDAFFFSEKFISLAVGPVGCLAGDTLVVTEEGAIPIADITRSMRVLSWNAETCRYELAQSSVAFPKGMDYLYRVVTPQGEFDAAGSHLLLCADNEYRRVEELRVGDVLKTCSRAPLQTTAGLSQSGSISGGQHSCQTAAGCPDGYGVSDRLYGLLARCLEAGVLAAVPLRSGARTCTPQGDLCAASPWGALQVELLARTRSELSAYLRQTGGFPPHTVPPHAAWGGRTSSGSFVCGGDSGLAGRLSRWMRRLRSRVHGLGQSALGSVRAWWSPLTTADRPIISLTRKQHKQIYWDLQVDGTHNYVTVDGAVHHNSTKTTAGIMKILYHASRMAACTDGIRRSRAVWVRNTREQLRDTSIPDFLKWFPDGRYGSYLKSEYKYLLKVGDIECEVLFRGLNDSDDVRRLLSLQASFGILEEFREINPDVFEALQGRLGRYPDGMMVPHRPEWGVDSRGNPIAGCVTDEGKPNKLIWGQSNPPDMDTYWEALLSAPPENVHVTIQPSALSAEADWLHFPTVSYEYYENLAAGKSEDYVDVYIHAKFGKSLSGQPVFRSFSREAHVAKSPLRPNMVSSSPLIIGFDCSGLNPAAVLGQLGYDGRLLIFDALCSQEMGALRFTRERLKPLLANKFPGMPVLVVIDPAGMQRESDERTVADIIRAEGFTVKPAARTNAIPARIAAVEYFLTRTVDGKHVLQIDPGADLLVKALAGKYRYKVKTNGEVEDKPDKSHPWSDVCFVAGTPILTPDGPKPIEYLRVGDTVAVRDGTDVVTAVGSRIVDRVLQLTLSDGTVLVCTEDHPFAVGTHTCFLPADMLTCKHPLVSVEEGIWASKASTVCVLGAVRASLRRLGASLKAKASTVANRVTTWPVEVLMVLSMMACGSPAPARTAITGIKGVTAPLCPYIGMSGSSIILRDLTGTPSTTLTVTLQTTTYQTSTVFPPRITPDTTCASGSQTAAWTSTRRLLKLVRRLRSGIGRLKGERGIGRWQPSQPLVVVAKDYLLGDYRVYNVTTSRTHTYYAGSALVHNCDAMQYLCLHASGGALFGGSTPSGRREVKPAPFRWAA